MEQNDHSADHDIHPSNRTCGTKVHYYFSNLKIKHEQQGMGLNMHTLVTILKFAQSYCLKSNFHTISVVSFSGRYRSVLLIKR